MSFEIAIVFGLILLAMALFAMDSIPFDLRWGTWAGMRFCPEIFFLYTLLTAMISNQATASILASRAIETAKAMGVEARLLFMTVTFAASLSLITPWGYQTNTLIYGPGRYRVHRLHQGRGAAESALLDSGHAFSTNLLVFLTGIHTQLVRYIASKNVWVNRSIRSRFLQNQLHPLFF